MVANFGKLLFLVVNAACKAEDEAHLRAGLSNTCVIEPPPQPRRCSRCRGRRAESVLAKLCAEAPADALHGRRSAPCRRHRLLRLAPPAIPARTVFEISVPAETRRAIGQNPAGEQRRAADRARGPATACGWRPGFASTATTIDTSTTPVEGRAGMVHSKEPPQGWRPRRRISRRRTGFSASSNGGAPRRRVGLRPEGPRPPCGRGAPLFADASSSEQIGAVTSGRIWAEPERAGGDGLSADAAPPRSAPPCSPNCAASACRCGSRPCPWLPIPTNAKESS